MEFTGYFVLRDGQEQGPYSLVELAKMWKRGVISGLDLYAYENMEKWEPVERLIPSFQRILPDSEPATTTIAHEPQKASPPPPVVPRPLPSRLIKCLDCGREVSKRAMSCPGCGAPLSSQPADAAQIRTNRAAYVLLGLFFGALGFHNFYAGNIGRGLTQLGITLIFGWVYIGLMITIPWSVIECLATTTDGYGNRFV